MIISFELFCKEDLKKLIEEGFYPEFLKVPFLHPHPSLNKFVPNGFRINKLQTGQIIKIYCDALKIKNNLLYDYISDEINLQFDDNGISDYLMKVVAGTVPLDYKSICDISEMLWIADLHVPAHFVFMLNGIRVSDELSETSNKLYTVHYETLNKSTESARKTGYDKGVELLDEKTKESEKQIEKLHSSLVAAQKQHASDIAEVKRERGEKDNALAEVESGKELIKQLQDQIERKKTIITKYENDLNHAKEQEKQLREQEKNNKQLSEQISILEKELSEKTSLLETLKQDAYSEDTLKQLVADVIDEMKASTLTREEILDLARRKFKDNETIRDGWNTISSQTDSIIQRIISSFDDKRFEPGLLDDIEALEDNVLIKCAVIKSMKAVLYKELEADSHSIDLGKRFGQ